MSQPVLPARLFKYHGTGNDFVILDERPHGVKASPPQPDWVARICDRHFGIGADGVLTILPAPRGDQLARMHITNADGSVPEMCGNGLRCVALYLLDSDSNGGSEKTFTVETDAGPRVCTVWRSKEGQGQVRLTMGRVTFGSDAGLPAELNVDLEGTMPRALSVSVGNPHLVMDAKPNRQQAERLGAKLVKSPGFPNGTNVEWLSRSPKGLDVLVYERGVGITLACGTGAVASAFAAEKWGWCSLGGEGVEVTLPGGVVQVSRGDDGEGVLKGPAERVFVANLG